MVWICLCVKSFFASELSYIGIISPTSLRINKKWVALLVLAIVVVAALVIGIWAGVGCSEKDPNPTDAVVTDPTGTTGGNDVTDPTDPSDPSTDPGTEPDDPSAGPPEVELNPDDKPAVGPTVPEDEDDDANEDNLVVDPGTKPTEPPKPPVSTDQFGGVTPSTIRYSDWQSWDRATRQAFYDKYIETCSDKEYHNIVKATVYKDYECGVEGHLCRTEDEHESFLEMLDEGCMYCGKHDCSSFFVLAKDGYYDINFDMCPEYDAKKDPLVYCPDCGVIKRNYAEVGEIACLVCLVDKNCPYCGEYCEAMECHHCPKTPGYYD